MFQIRILMHLLPVVVWHRVAEAPMSLSLWKEANRKAALGWQVVSEAMRSNIFLGVASSQN